MDANQVVNSLTANAGIVLPVLVGFGGLIVLALYLRARARHVLRLREQLNGAVQLPKAMQEALAKLFNVDSAEFATIGAVTFVDIAWHYSMADPHIWDHFQGPMATHMADAIQNLDVLRASLGNQATATFGHILSYFKALEATQAFHDILRTLAAASGTQVATAAALDASASTLIDRLSKLASVGINSSASDAGLLHHIPVVTIGFASYRAWKRSQSGAGLGRNLEFAAIEVATRTGGGLVGSQVGGAVGTAIIPGAGTVVGGIAGAVAGVIGGAILGEEFKQRHVKSAQSRLDQALIDLGEYHLQHPGRFRELTEVFTSQEKAYERNLGAIQWRLTAYSLLPWRIVWPNQTQVLLQETVKMARERLNTIKKGAIDAVDQVTYMRDRRQHHEMGLILWNDPALRQQLVTEPKLVGAVDEAAGKLKREIRHLGVTAEAATA